MSRLSFPAKLFLGFAACSYLWTVLLYFASLHAGVADGALSIDGLTARAAFLDPGVTRLAAGLLRLGYDGFLPATAHAAVEILRRSGIEIEGRDAVVIGRSAVVGMPAAFLLVREDATVTVCHTRTRDLAGHIRRAEIVVVAAGVPGLVTGQMLRPGAVVVDVGINVVDGRIVGDVDFASAREVASAITPVPGGVGPLTNALLLTHLIRAAEHQAPVPPPVAQKAHSRGDR